MADYVFCTRKSNKPRMNVKVCLARCSEREECREISDYLETGNEMDMLYTGPRPVEIGETAHTPIG